MLVRVGALRCATCGVVDPDGATTTEAPPLFAAPPPKDPGALPPDAPRKAGAWRVALAVPVMVGVFFGTRGALHGSSVWLGVALVSVLVGAALSWDEIRRTIFRSGS